MTSPQALEIQNLPGWICSRFDAERVETHCGGEIQDSQARFPLASVTKTFSAHLCLQPPCREQIDTRLRDILPYFKLQDPEASDGMTARDALCHLSGLAPHTEDWVRCELSRRDYIRQRLPLLPSEGPFREKHRYSNLMYAVLGQWLEEIKGISWEQQISNEILEPLGMTRTGHLDENWTRDVASPHAFSAEGVPESIPPFYARSGHLIAPASELIGSMPDLARWGQFMLQQDPEDERWRPHNRVQDTRSFAAFGVLDYGLGWRLDSVNGEPRVWHSGQCSGYSSLLTLYPRRKIGMAAATNCSSAVEALQILDLESGFSPTNSNTTNRI